MIPDTIIQELNQMAHPEFKSGMARFGISNDTALGIKMPVLRAYAKKLGKNHNLALQLWETNIHEARLLAVLIADPKQVTEQLMEEWLRDFDSWDICDQCCGVLFDKTPWAYQKAVAWTERTGEYQKRAGFVMMAELAVHDKKAVNPAFEAFFPLIAEHADDDRNFVKKAVNWALRQIGKRNAELRMAAIRLALQIQLQPAKSAKWIAADALRELTVVKPNQKAW